MNIYPVNNFQIYKYSANLTKKNENKIHQNHNNIGFQGDEISDEQYRNAKAYADNIFKLPLEKRNYNLSINDIDLDRLEGIQKGIEVFDGLSMKEIYFTFRNLTGILAKRGCTNQCKHCFISAMPPIREDANQINGMLFEDFENLMDGIKELNKRIGTSIISNYSGKQNKPTLSLFLDADCMEIAMRDKQGKIHELPEIIDKFYDSTERQFLFDTASWNHKNPVMQKRAENVVKYLADPSNMQKIYQINLSISPFHSIYTRALELGYDPIKKEIPTEKALLGKQLYDTYVERIANMLVTFSPLAFKPEFSIITRPAPKNTPNMNNFTMKGYSAVIDDILNRTKTKLLRDLCGDKKYVSYVFQIKSLLEKYGSMMQNPDSDLLMTGKFEELFKSKNPDLSYYDIREIFPKYQPSSANNVPVYRFIKLNEMSSKYIDSNGKVYVTDHKDSRPTEIQLNFIQKDKTTKPLGIITENTVTKSQIEELYYREFYAE